MAQQKQRTPKRWRSKEAREIAAAVERAGGTVELTGKGHLRITGPKGIAVVASAPDAGRQGGRALANTWATITDKTGLTFPGLPGAETQADQPRKPRQTRPALTRQPRQGAVTRWKPGETYGFITGPDGRSWFVSRDSLPDGTTELPEGTGVAFTGSPTPKARKGYPEALRVRVAAEQPGTQR